MVNKLIRRIFLLFLVALPGAARAEINSFYDLKLKYEEIKESIANFRDSVVNSPIYETVFYFGSTIAVFIVIVIVIFFIFAMLRR